MAFVSETLTFDKTHRYNTLKTGITLTAILHYGQESVKNAGKTAVAATC